MLAFTATSKAKTRTKEFLSLHHVCNPSQARTRFGMELSPKLQTTSVARSFNVLYFGVSIPPVTTALRLFNCNLLLQATVQGSEPFIACLDYIFLSPGSCSEFSSTFVGMLVSAVSWLVDSLQAHVMVVYCSSGNWTVHDTRCARNCQCICMQRCSPHRVAPCHASKLLSAKLLARFANMVAVVCWRHSLPRPLPSREEMVTASKSLPSESEPSDHVLISAALELNRSPSEE